MEGNLVLTASGEASEPANVVSSIHKYEMFALCCQHNLVFCVLLHLHKSGHGKLISQSVDFVFPDNVGNMREAQMDQM